jgi:hypothetical protein
MSGILPAQDILNICDERGIVLIATGEKLSIDALEETITPDLLEKLRQHKTCLIRLLQKGRDELDAKLCESDPDSVPPEDLKTIPWDECIEPSHPCSLCGGILFWWDVLGIRHCMACEAPQYPPEKATELQKLAKRLRQFPRKVSSLRQGR